MSFRKISGNDLLTIEHLDKPIEGTFTGTRELPKGFAYQIQTENGQVELADCTDLNKKMIKVNLGQTVRISSLGKRTTSSGREMFVSLVEVKEIPADYIATEATI